MPGPGNKFFGRAMAAFAMAMLAAIPAAPARAAVHSQTKSYDWGIGDLMVLCSNGRGGACFGRADGDTRVAITVTDDLLNPVGLVLEFRDSENVTVGNLVPGCGQIPSTHIPATVTTIVVNIDGPLFGPQDCLLQGLGIGTTGKIKATFT